MSDLRIFRLIRTGTGVVGEAVIFRDGTAVLHWLTAPSATEVYASEKDMREIRESSGRSVFEELFVPQFVSAQLEDS